MDSVAMKSLTPFSLEPAESMGLRWERWVARFDNYLIAAKVTEDARQKAQLLHVGGEDVFDLYLTLDDCQTGTYKELKDALLAHFMPKRNVEYKIYSRSYAEDVTSVTSGASQGPHSFNLVFVCLCVCLCHAWRYPVSVPYCTVPAKTAGHNIFVCLCHRHA